MDNHPPIPQLSEVDEIRFKKLVLQEGTLTITAIREQMSPVLDEYDDIPLIRKMLKVLEKGED
jgi:hypothetical protein